jgi:nitrous oxidase accessory protein NosD
VRPARLGHGLAEAEAIRDVVVQNNEFHDRPGTALFIGGASHVSVSRNRISAALAAELRRKGSVILIERSSGVNLADNAVSDPRPGTAAAVEISPNVAQGEDGVRISRLDAKLHAQAQVVVDRRTGSR